MQFNGRSSRQNLQRVSDHGELYFLIPDTGPRQMSKAKSKPADEKVNLLGSIDHFLMKGTIIDCMKYTSEGGDERVVLTGRFKTRRFDAFTRLFVKPFKDRQKFVVCQVNLVNSDTEIDASTVEFLNKHNGKVKFNFTSGITGGLKWFSLWINRKMIKELFLFGEKPESSAVYEAFKVRWRAAFRNITGTPRNFAEKVVFLD